MEDTQNNTVSVILVTCPDEKAAHAIAEHLVGSQVAACVNIIPNISSVYSWKGEICRDPEYLLIIKARTEMFEAVRSHVLAKHPYEVPEVIALPVINGHEPYLTWVFDGDFTEENQKSASQEPVLQTAI